MSVTTGQLQKIRRSGVWGRNIASCLIAFALVEVTFMCLLVARGGVPGQVISLGPYQFPSTALEPWSGRVYVASMLATFSALAIASLYLIRAVFSDLALGNIFCGANVRRIRNLGWVAIAIGIFYLLLPLTKTAYFMLASQADIAFRDETTLFVGLGQIVSGGLYILLSWIMAVGLGVREDAEELRRDAELVI
jgi:hypothetical protein